MARVVIPGFRKIEVSGSGEGTSNYNDLENKPSINNVPLVGNLNTADLKLTDSTLTEEGVPAEAKTVGDKLEAHSTSLTTLKKETTVNLLKPTLETISYNGITCTNNGDGTYTLNGTAIEDTDFSLFGEWASTNTLVSEGTYNVLFNDSIIDGLLLITAFNTTTLNKTGTSSIVNAPNGISYVIIRVYSGTTLNNKIVKPILTTNLNATYDDFVPYTGSTGKINSDVASLLKRIEALESITNKTATTTVESE